jgi:hypothetical protein
MQELKHAPERSARNLEAGEASVANAVRRLVEIFRAEPDKYRAQEKSRPVMEEMARDADFLPGVLARHLRSRDALNRRHFPVVAFEIEANRYFELVANAWLPLPSRETNISTKAIHHHGELLLTTVTIFGAGYEHWLLNKPKELDPERSLYSMELVERGRHGFGEAAFVDAYVAHVPLFPSDLAITVCLWSSRKTASWRDDLKRIGIVRRHSDVLRRVVASTGLGRTLDVKTVHYFDYYPTPAGFVGMAEREEFGLGPNQDYLQSLFHILQTTGHEPLGELIEARLEDDRVANPGVVRDLLNRLRAGEPIEPRLSPGHYGVPHANFTREAIKEALAAPASDPA